jgi:hypothetical protein
MKILLTTLLLTGFVAVTVFGFFGMHVGIKDHNGNCIVSKNRSCELVLANYALKC